MAKKINLYINPVTGEKLPSVTQILSMIAKPQLMYWYGKHGNDTCKKILEESGDFGSKVHSLIEQTIKGQKVTLNGKFTDIIENFKIITSGWEFVEFEKILINEKCGYGGTADAIVQIDGIKALVDFKTSSAIYPEHYLQVAAYMECLPECTHAYIVHLDKETNGWEVLEAKTEGLFPVFQAAQVIYKHLKGGK